MNNPIKIILKAITALLFFMPVISYAAPELILTWKASSYVPANYAGKALPAANTPIDVLAILIDDGKVISLAPYDINWYAGEERIVGGKGAVRARTTAPNTGQDSLELRVNVGKYKDHPLDAFLTVPIVRPEIFIFEKAGAKRHNFSVIPYFWNITAGSDLAVTWDDAGDSVTAHAANKKNEMEFAQITVPKQ
jgi:hypothetical protein